MNRSILLKNPSLRRFWFALSGRPGLGVTACSLSEAQACAQNACARLGWIFEPNEVMEDVDIRTIDQNHVIPNMGRRISRVSGFLASTSDMWPLG